MKRYLLLLISCVMTSICVMAAPNIGGNGTVYLTGFQPGDLAKVLNGETVDGLTGSVEDLKSATKIYFGDDQGSLTLNDDDLDALTACTSATQLDMGKALLAEGTDITKLASSAEYIELPFGTYTKEELEGLKTNNSSLKFAAALSNKTNAKDYVGYSYQAGNLKNFKDQGLMSTTDISHSETNVTLYGTLNSTDLSNLNNVLNVHQKVTDISDATLEGALTDVNNVMDASQFLIIPNTKSGTWNEEWTDYSLSSTDGYPHFGFFTDADKKQLYAHTGDNENGKDMANLANFVDETMTLTVLPDLNTDGTFKDYLNGSNNATAAANYLEGIGALTLGCVDLSWFNMSGIKTNNKYDYSKLVKVSHLVIPHNNNADDMADTDKFIYPDNIKTVADYSSKTDKAGQQVYIDGQLYQFGDEESATAVLVRTAGSLEEAHNLWNPRMTNADTYIAAGTLSNDDVTALNSADIKSTTVDLHHATVTGIENYANSNVEYLALPDGQGGTINATSATQCAYSNCASLKCVAGFNPDENKLYTFSTEVGCIKKMTDIIRPKTSSRYDANSCTGLAHVVMSGTLNHDDINTTVSNDNSTNYGMGNAEIETSDLTWAVFPNQDDMCFNTAGGYEKMTHIDLPITSQTKLPTSCFDNCQKLNDLCIPGTYEEIGQYAFRNCAALTHVYTTGVDEDATSFTSDMGANTVTLPPSLKIIRSFAFSNVKRFTDVYVTTPNDSPAPECEQDAFDAGTYWGNNTVFGGRGWDRVRVYDDNGNIKLALAYLHWPESDGERNKVYTDVTRAYSIPANEGVTDINGDLIYFPSQAEMIRSFLQGEYGYTWESWGTARNNYYSQAEGFNYYDIINPFYGTGASQAEVDAKSDANYTFDKKYAGWHQFVLSANYSYIPRIDMSNYKENDWYTICMPYDLTKEELLTLFGAQYEDGKETKVDGEVLTEGQKKYPKVVTLTGAKRDKVNSTIYLHLSKDLLGNNVQWNFDEFYSRSNNPYKYTSNSPVIARNHTEEQQYIAQTDDDPVVIKAGYPYLIKPYLSEKDLADANAGNRAVPFSKDASLRPFMLYKVTATNGTIDEQGEVVDLDDNAYTGTFADTGNGDGNENLFSYFFVGTFERVEGGIPTYAYYLGKAKSGGKHKFFRHTASTAKNWSKYSCIILPNPGKLYWDTNDSYTPKFPIAAQDDSFKDGTGSAKATSYEMYFDESEVTGIREIENGSAAYYETIGNGKVYNVNGQYVGTSLEGLAKGMYIVNGKKYIVK